MMVSSQRSAIMRAVKSRGNISTELRFVKILKLYKISGWRRNVPLLGQPDFIFKKFGIAVFIHGCFWHGCKLHFRQPVENSEYWSKKIERNRKRDLYVCRSLRKLGWSVLTFWEHDFSRKDYIVRKLRKKIITRVEQGYSCLPANCKT